MPRLKYLPPRKRDWYVGPRGEFRRELLRRFERAMKAASPSGRQVRFTAEPGATDRFAAIDLFAITTAGQLAA